MWSRRRSIISMRKSGVGVPFLAFKEKVALFIRRNRNRIACCHENFAISLPRVHAIRSSIGSGAARVGIYSELGTSHVVSGWQSLCRNENSELLGSLFRKSVQNNI